MYSFSLSKYLPYNKNKKETETYHIHIKHFFPRHATSMLMILNGYSVQIFCPQTSHIHIKLFATSKGPKTFLHWNLKYTNMLQPVSHRHRHAQHVIETCHNLKFQKYDKSWDSPNSVYRHNKSRIQSLDPSHYRTLSTLTLFTCIPLKTCYRVEQSRTIISHFHAVSASFELLYFLFPS